MSFSYLVKPMSYVLVIVAGYLLKRAGFFKPGDRQVLTKIMLNITLPCAILQGFSGFERDAGLLMLVLIGFACTFLPMLLMVIATRKDDKPLRAYRMINICGFNIGCFSLPLVQAFFGAEGMVAACMYDTGNAIMMTGGSYTMASSALKLGGRVNIRSIALKFLESTPFDMYLVIFALMALDVTIPPIIFELTQPIASANGFIAMLTVGMAFELAGDVGMLRETAREILLRYAIAAVSAAACYYLTPFSQVARQTMAVLCFAPISALAPVYTERCGGDTALAGFTNSVSIAISLVIMLTLSMIFVA